MKKLEEKLKIKMAQFLVFLFLLFIITSSWEEKKPNHLQMEPSKS